MVNEMKSKTITQLILLSLLCLVAIPMVQAAKPVKLLTHEVYEGVFPLPPEEPTAWCRAVIHGIIIKKGQIDGYDDVKATMLQKFILYDSEGGERLAIVKITLQYVGTITGFDSNGDLTEAFYTGKMVVDMVVNVIGEMADAPENSHYVVWYEEGEPVKSNGFGELPF